jgi:5-methylcytosine-specific restriction protein A
MKTNRKKYAQSRNKINNPYYQSRHWKATRLEALTRDNFQCQPCKRQGRVKSGNIGDHIEPLKQGGSKEVYNVECSCSKCHAVKSAKERRN